MADEEPKENCQICRKVFGLSDLIPGGVVRPTVIEVIKKKHRDWNPQGYICRQDLDNFRRLYIQSVLEVEKGELSRLDHEVIKSLMRHDTLANKIGQDKERYTFGERMADRVASFGGSWAFIGIFAAIILFWIVINAVLIAAKPVDPYPFILLNLMLSCLAAIQAPVIMMSQSRQEKKDRLRAEHDYKVNLKAELEIRHLHEKMDHLLHTQWQRLLEIQEMQTELMENLRKRE